MVITDDIKAAAIADLQAGEQPAVVAGRYKINPATVRSWKLRLESSATGSATQPATVVATQQRKPTLEEKQLTIAELVIRNLEAKLTATQRIAEYVQRGEWIDKQNAADVAELFGVLDKSAVGILDRLAAAQRPGLSDPDA